MENWHLFNGSQLTSVLRANDTKSTPGCCKEVTDMKLHDLVISVQGKATGSSVRIWVGQNNGTTLSYSPETEFKDGKTTSIDYFFENNDNLDHVLVGVCFSNPKQDALFEFSSFVIDKVQRAPIDVLFLSLQDSASSGWDLCKCLRLLGLTTQMLQGKRHVFEYTDQAPVYPLIDSKCYKLRYEILGSPFIVKIEDEYINKLIEQSKFIVWHGCTLVVSNAVTPDKMKHSAPFAIGRNYRRDPISCGQHFRKCSSMLASTPDLYGISHHTKNKDVLLQWPIHLEKYPAFYEFENPEKIIVGHFPSNTKAKNTLAIVSAIEELESDEQVKDKFEYIGLRGHGGTVPWPEHVKRYRRCDVYIESLQLEVEGSKCGTWGVTCFEAAASGCIIVTNQLYADVYKKEYGDCPVYIANSEEEITAQVKKLVLMDRETLLAEKKKTRKWVERNHGYWGTAKRTWETVLKDHFDHGVQRKVKKLIKKKDNALKDEEEKSA